MYRHLLSPVKIGNLTLDNRIAMAPMGVEIVESDGSIREPVLAYYEERARGGAGLIITENTAACYPRGANTASEIALSHDKYLPGLSALAERVHRHGSKIAVQLAHHGKVSRFDTQQGHSLLMPSVPRHTGFPAGPLDLTAEELTLMGRAAGGAPTIHEATEEDLEGLVSAFADAAARARRAGFDGVELHAAHGYIFSEFLSQAWNFREDAWGGALENRARLLCDTLRACKARAGHDFPIWCRLDATEFGVEDGICFDDAKQTAALAVAAGADAIHVSAYANPIGAGFTRGPLVHAPSGYVEFAAEIKARVDVPVIAVGRIEAEVGDQIIADGKADIIAMGRKLLADPELPKKLATGRTQEVRPCIYCYVCVAQPFFDRRVRCAVNPVTGRETECASQTRTKAPQRRRILVVGGGPAGMEAARVAALRGHDVALFEKSSQLGGTLRFAALVYPPNEQLLRWYVKQMHTLPIDLHLDSEATAESIRERRPDAVIAAIGARRQLPDLKGADLDHVFDGNDLRGLLAGSDAANAKLSWPRRLAVRAGQWTGITTDPAKLRAASRAYMPLGKRVTILGGGLVGVEIAHFLVERGRQVVILERGAVLATEMAHPRRWHALFELREAGVRMESDVTVSEITPTQVHWNGPTEPGGPVGNQSVDADAVIIATGLEADAPQIEALTVDGIPVRSIGDASGVGYIEGAVHDGFRTALEI